jgi:hypothetical protein
MAAAPWAEEIILPAVCLKGMGMIKMKEQEWGQASTFDI